MAGKSFVEMRSGDASPVRAGQLAPTFRLRDVSGDQVASIDLLAQGPLVISFYRGSWCDFCDTALERLSALDADIRARGGQQLAIGPPPASAEQQARLAGLVLPVLVDPGLEVTRAFGLGSTVPTAERERYVSLGYPAPDPSMRSTWQITIPATYVIDTRGRVVMASIDTDYRNRLEGRDIVSVLRALHDRVT